MFVVKKGIIAAVCCIIAAGIILGVCVSASSAQASSITSTLPTVVVDPGHGGIDAGVCGVNTKVKESAINLAISKYLKGYFTNAGFNCVLTRATQAGLYGTTAKGFKMRDMLARKSIIEENNADMVISIHQNFSPLSSRRGAFAFYDKDSACGKALAQSIQNSINDMEQCVKKNNILTGDFFMLKCTESASVLVECGFLSNAEDEKLLISEEYQRAVAYAIFKGAVNYFS
ncbi:MAG: N-acetylmuramoyl-L-alanine amidase [Candidatus Coproplasma sp.]